ncbi:MAG: hypothetical protein OHK0046_09070 [Anaerolineae bacterium]
MNARIRVLLLLLFVLMSTLTSAVVTAQDDEQTGLTFIQLKDGEAVTNSFEEEVNAHLYVFFGSAGDVVTITMLESAESQLDPYLALLGPAGQVYAANDDIDPASIFSASIEDFELPQDGAYFVLATSFTGLRRPIFVPEGEEAPEPQFYEITVTGNTIPEDLVDAEAFTFFYGQLEIGESSTLAITAEEPVFYVLFSGEEGDVVTIRTEPAESSSVDTALHLFDANGNRIAINDDGENLGLYSEIANFELPADGTYMVFATAYDFNDAIRPDWSNVGQFVLTIE